MRKEKLEELKNIVEELKTVEVIKREVKQEEKFLQSEAYYFKLNNGLVIPREKLVKDKKDGSAAIIMPVTQDKEILTVIEPRVFTELTVGVGFPAGYIEPGETPVEGAFRELLEETGYYGTRFIEMDSFYQDEGCSEALNHIFLANCIKAYNQSLDNDEVVRYMLFNYDELFELEEMGYIKGVNTKLALQKSKEYLKKEYMGIR